MKFADAKHQFEEQLTHDGLSLLDLRPAAGIAAMVRFYGTTRAEDCDIQSDGDTLLFQWGTYDWGQGKQFEFGITRQFVGAGGEDEDIWQLSLTFRYQPESSLTALDRGDRWCCGLDELSAFESFILTSPACVAVSSMAGDPPELYFECAG